MKYIPIDLEALGITSVGLEKSTVLLNDGRTENSGFGNTARTVAKLNWQFDRRAEAHEASISENSVSYWVRGLLDGWVSLNVGKLTEHGKRITEARAALEQFDGSDRYSRDRIVMILEPLFVELERTAVAFLPPAYLLDVIENIDELAYVAGRKSVASGIKSLLGISQ